MAMINRIHAALYTGQPIRTCVRCGNEASLATPVVLHHGDMVCEPCLRIERGPTGWVVIEAGFEQV